MITVHPQNKGVVEIINPNLANGPWIAGGAALKWYQGLVVSAPSDIDVFCKSEKQYNEVVKRITTKYVKDSKTVYDNEISVAIETDNAITFEICETSKRSPQKIQIIKRKFYNSAETVIADFDISVCQIVTAGNEWILGDNTAKDIRERNLRMLAPIRKGAVQRLLKYWAYGYRPVDGLLESMTDKEYFKTTHQEYGTI